VDECITSCFYLEKFSSVKIYKNIQPNITFYSEWAIVNTILQNLIENAIKYSRGDVASFVRINIQVERNQLLISVEDNGEGIPQNLQASMFNMFVRGNSRHKGSGLGLYILHRAVERLKGTIKVESKLYEGSIFTVSLPLTEVFNL
jgi:signal transduction histidine kinase